MFVGQEDTSPGRLVRRAWAEEREGRSAAARALFVRAVSDDETSSSRFEFAAYLARQGDARGAAVEWTRIFEAAAPGDDDELLRAVCHNLATLARRSRNWPLAREWQQRANAVPPALTFADESTEASGDLVAAANDALAARRWGEAKRLLRAALREAGAEHDTGRSADVLGTCGVLHQLTGRLRRAVACHRDAYPLHCRAGDDAGAAADCLNLSGIAIRRGRVRAALSAARLAVRHAVRSGERSLIHQADAHSATLRNALGKLTRPATRN